MTASRVLLALSVGALPLAAFAAGDRQNALKAERHAREMYRRSRLTAEQAERDARETLERSMRLTAKLRVVAIVERRGDGELPYKRIKLEQDAGKQALTVLHPLRAAGVTFVDDGHRRLTYLPDDQVLIEEESVRPLMEDAERRLELAMRNYVLRQERSQPVAGRPTVQIVAVPRVEGLPTRQFVLDRETLYLLRMATVGPQGRAFVHVDTKAISYPRDLPQGAFRMDTLGRARKIRREPPMPVDHPSQVADRLGFVPHVPERLPMGFVVQNVDVRPIEKGRSVVMRLTDGLATALAYQYRCPEMPNGIRHMNGRSMLAERGVVTLLVSDLPAKARHSILESFARRRPAAVSISSGPAPGPSQAYSTEFNSPPPVPSKEPDDPEPMLATEEESENETDAEDCDPGPDPVPPQHLKEKSKDEKEG